MPSTNTYGRVFKYAPLALKVHELLLENGPTKVSDMDALIELAAEQLPDNIGPTGHVQLLPIMEFGGLIEIDRLAEEQNYKVMYTKFDRIRAVPQTSSAVVEDVKDEVYEAGFTLVFTDCELDKIVSTIEQAADAGLTDVSFSLESEDGVTTVTVIDEDTVAVTSKPKITRAEASAKLAAMRGEPSDEELMELGKALAEAIKNMETEPTRATLPPLNCGNPDCKICS